jgi:lipopolysaccharide/colanic/teichoic acid biosynthesis glycosyltransferase
MLDQAWRPVEEETMLVSESNLTPTMGFGQNDSEPVTDPGLGASKRLTDLAIGAALAVLLAPVVLVAMALVRATSRGPAIYRQVRLGRGNQRYTIYKIRSMYHDCEAKTGPAWSTKGDSRVTPIGRILRATHVDELPQLWNVLRGEMSLVGPRPERPEIAVNLDMVIPRYSDRLRVRPGLTGLAQVQLPPDTSLADVKRKLACDLYYIEHADLWFDLRILASTASYVLGIPFELPKTVLRVPSVEVVEALDSGQGAPQMQAV